MNGLWALGVQDFKRLRTNALFWVITATLILIVAVVRFALPQALPEENFRIYTYNTRGFAGISTAADSEEALRQAVKQGGSIGLLGGGDGKVTVLHPGMEKAARAALVLLRDTGGGDIPVVRLRESGQTLPFNQRTVPIFICFEALIVGFVLGGALMLSEKEEGTIRALRVSPMGVDRYLISKTLFFSALGTLYAFLMAFLCLGFHFSVPRFMALSFFGAAIFSLMGLGFTIFFKDISSWFFSMALLLSVNMLPVAAYSNPSFSPPWLRVIPSYALLFAYEKILFQTGELTFSTVLTVGGWCVGAYLLSRITVGRQLIAFGRR
jgi:hypothetical protein